MLSIDHVGITKLNALTIIFEREKVSERLATTKKVSLQLLLNTLSLEHNYSLKDELKLSAAGISKLVKRVFPEKPSGNTKICTYLLHKYGAKYCPQCKRVSNLDNFFSNGKEADGLHSWCKSCYYASTNTSKITYNAARRSDIEKHYTPKWANIDKIREIYNNKPKGCHVDHIIPLRGLNVCGLHVETNLQYLPAKENLAKGNSFS